MSLLEGSWGGQGISLTFDGAGVSIEFDCARGRITQRLAPDGRGRFDVSGTHDEEAGGASKVISGRDEDGTVGGAKSAGRAARYAGRIEGKTMTLTVTLADGRSVIGTFKLVRGAPARLRKCR